MPAPPLSASELSGGTHLVTAARVRSARGVVVLREGAGAVLVAEKAVLIDQGYALFQEGTLRRIAGQLPIHPLNPLVALRWALTDLYLRLNALSVQILLTVTDYQANIVPVPYAHGFAIGTSAHYTQAYPYGQPEVNVGFDRVAATILSAMLSAQSGLSYVADITSLQAFAPYLDPLRALLAANHIMPATWQALYQTSAVETAALQLTQASDRHFGQDPDPSHIGANTARSAYGYSIMKAISLRDMAALSKVLADFALPQVAPLPTVTTR